MTTPTAYYGYIKQTWADEEIGNTPLTAARLNHMEDGIDNAEIPAGAQTKADRARDQAIEYAAANFPQLVGNFIQDVQIPAGIARDAEVTAAIATAVATETSARQAADATLAANVTAEVTARQNADTAITSSVTAETSARQAADTTITSSLTAETSARQAADSALDAALTTETTARADADEALQLAITEFGSGFETPAGAQAKVDTALDAVSDEVDARTAENIDIRGDFAAADAAEAAARTAAVSAEATARADADSAEATARNSAVATEATARAAADTAVRTDIGAEILDVRGDFAAADSAIRTDFAAADALRIPLSQKGAANGVAPLNADGVLPATYLPPISIGTPVVVEDEAAMLALDVEPGTFAVRPDGTFLLIGSDPSVLSNWSEVGAAGVSSVNGQIGPVVLDAGDVGADPAGAADDAYDAAVADATSRVATEAGVRAAADTAQNSALASESAARTSADTTLGNSIAAEVTARTTAVTNEATTRAAADTTETNARIAAITAEATSRASADTAETNARIAAVTAEANARAAADSTLAGQIAAAETPSGAQAKANAARDAAIASAVTAAATAGDARYPVLVAGIIPDGELSTNIARINDLAAAIASEVTARNTAIGVVSNDVGDLSQTVSDLTQSVGDRFAGVDDAILGFDGRIAAFEQSDLVTQGSLDDQWTLHLADIYTDFAEGDTNVLAAAAVDAGEQVAAALQNFVRGVPLVVERAMTTPYTATLADMGTEVHLNGLTDFYFPSDDDVAIPVGAGFDWIQYGTTQCIFHATAGNSAVTVRDKKTAMFDSTTNHSIVIPSTAQQHDALLLHIEAAGTKGWVPTGVTADHLVPLGTQGGVTASAISIMFQVINLDTAWVDALANRTLTLQSTGTTPAIPSAMTLLVLAGAHRVKPVDGEALNSVAIGATSITTPSFRTVADRCSELTFVGKSAGANLVATPTFPSGMNAEASVITTRKDVNNNDIALVGGNSGSFARSVMTPVAPNTLIGGRVVTTSQSTNSRTLAVAPHVAAAVDVGHVSNYFRTEAINARGYAQKIGPNRWIISGDLVA